MINLNRHEIKNICSKLLSSRHLPLLLACLAVLMVSPSLGMGLQLDDYFHKVILQHLDPITKDYNPITKLFTFVENTDQIKDMMKRGLLPWWASENLRIAFCRPLTAVTHWLDYQLWPDLPALMHLHNMLWFAGLIFTAALIYRKMITPAWVAGLAALLYAIEDAHGIPAGWIANRNALISGVFGFMSLYLHIRWRREQWRAGAVLAPLCFLLGLLSAEAGVAVGAYLISFELLLASDRWRQRVYSFLPYVAVTVAWRICYQAAGFGTSGSGAYVDPGHNPLAFLALLIDRLPLLLYGQFWYPDAVFFGYLPEKFAFFALLCVYALLAVILYVLMPLLKRDPVARFWALGMLLALIPSVAVFPANRLLIVAGLGAMGLLASFFAAWFEKPGWLPASPIWRKVAGVMMVLFIWIHGVLAPILLPIESVAMVMTSKNSIEKPFLYLARNEDLEDKTVIVINTPIPMMASTINFICEQHRLPKPEKVFVLESGATSVLTIRRIDEHTLEFEPDNGFIDGHFEGIFRGPENPMQVGQQVDMAAFQVKVISLTKDQRPLRVRFTFDKPLEDASYLFCQWVDGRYTRFDFPVEGQTIKVKTEMKLP